MKRIYVPSTGPEDWKRLLAKPDLHWKPGYSAMTAATCWDSAGTALPPEVQQVLHASGEPALDNLQLLAALPEWETPLPGGDRPSCTDVMAITRNASGLVIIAVEAKVDEPFGPTVGEKKIGSSPGQMERLHYLDKLLNAGHGFDDSIRYQLLHRTASALLTAQQFHAATAVLLIHSFSPVARWREDFTAFCTALGTEPVSENVFEATHFSQPRLFLAWCAVSPRIMS